MYITLLLVWLFLFSARSVSAQVLINEVHPYPSSGSDWIELINLSPLPVDLHGWFIKDVLSSPTIIYSFTDSILQPLELLVVEVSNKLNNGGDGVTLYNSNQEIIDSMTFSQSFSSMSWARELDGIGNFISTTPSREEYNNPEVIPSFPPQISPPPSTPSPTPTIVPAPTPAPSPSPSAQNYAYLSLSEVVACPTEGNQEWVELFNNSPERIELKDWIIKDSHSNQRIFDLEIDPWSYGIVTWSGALLNNSGDQLVLVTPNNYELETLDLPSCTSGTSYARFNDEWEFTDDITPGSANSKSNNLTPSPSPTSSTSAILSNTSPISTASSSQTQDATQQESQLATLPYQGTLPNLKPSAQVLGASIDTNNNSLDSVSAPLRPPSFSALSAIIGGLCITLVGSYSLYETLNQETSSMD